MLRKHLYKTSLETEPEFRYQGKQPGRLEGISDAVFAFAITLLVVSLEVPNSFDDLMKTFQSVLAFGVSSLLLFSIWREHYYFFLRYGLQDKRTIFLNAILLLTILLYIYPLRFLFQWFNELVVGLYHMIANDSKDYLKNVFTEMLLPEQIPQLMMLYGIGAAIVFTMFALMYRNALRLKEALGLNQLEETYTRASIYLNLCMAAPPLVSVCVSLSIQHPGSASFWSGMSYMLYSLMPLYTRWENKTKERALKEHQEKE